MIDISKALTQLAIDRPVFHSEADFQHALAWQLQKQEPTHNIRLEYRPAKIEQKTYVDLWVEDGAAKCAIELKYKTRSLEVVVGTERFKLLNQSAQDIARYDFCKDLCRLEALVSAYPGLIGFAVFLTNDQSYWQPGSRDTNVDHAFRMHEATELAGELGWAKHASAGTTKGRTSALALKGSYGLAWQEYSTVSDARGGSFRMLSVAMPGANG